MPQQGSNCSGSLARWRVKNILVRSEMSALGVWPAAIEYARQLVGEAARRRGNHCQLGSADLLLLKFQLRRAYDERMALKASVD